MFTETIKGSYKIEDIPSYVAYKKDKWNSGITQEEIDKLSPNNINSKSFWEWIENNPELAKDAICFGATKEVSIDDANKQNFGLAAQLSIFNYILLFKDYIDMPILDIGAGCGMLKNYVEKETKHRYYGVDVYPKIPDVLPLEDDSSLLPESIRNTKFGLVVSTNVFQHLSVEQRRHYYEQVSNLLVKNGVFSFSTMCKDDRAGFKCKETGKSYMCHYGQYTEIQSFQETFDDLTKHFTILTYSIRPMDLSVTFHCTTKS